MKGVEIYRLIKPQLGSIEATGEHGIDMERLENFKTYEELINCLLEDLDQVIYASERSYENSVKAINRRAKELLIDINEWIEEYRLDWE